MTTTKKKFDTVTCTLNFLWKASYEINNISSVTSQAIVKDFKNGVDDANFTENEKITSSVCSNCGSLFLPTTSRVRLKPKKKFNGKKNAWVKKKAEDYLNTTSVLSVHCSICKKATKTKTVGRTEIEETKCNDRPILKRKSSMGSFNTSQTSTPTSLKKQKVISSSKKKKRSVNRLAHSVSMSSFNASESPHNTSLKDFLTQLQ